MISRESILLSACTVLATTLAAVCCVAAAPPSDPIILDGRFEDWDTVPVALTDPADAAGAVVDLGAVRITDDPQFVDLSLELGQVVNIQKLDGRVLVLLDTDGDPRTGRRAHDLEGTDLAIELTPPHRKRPDQPGMGIGLVSSSWEPDPRDPDSKPLSPYLVGFTFAPTYASDRVEMRLRRGSDAPGARRILTSDQFSIQFIAQDAAGTVVDSAEPITYQLTTKWARKPVIAPQPSDPLARSSDRALRVMTWNAEFGGMFKKPAPFARVLAALEPDVILFQELRAKDSAATLHAFLSQAMQSDQWQVLVGEGGGNLRCAIASRRSLSEVSAMRLLTYPGRRDRSLRVAAATIELDGRRILLGSVHLKCCGSVGSSEDRTRETEATILSRALASVPEGSIDGIVIAGDLNLVGGYGPLQTLVSSSDLDGSALEIAEPLQLDGRSNATWSEPHQPFVPGRLDFLLYSESALSLAGGFVFDAADLAPRWARQSGVRPDDTASASDHLPVVIDLQWPAAD